MMLPKKASFTSKSAHALFRHVGLGAAAGCAALALLAPAAPVRAAGALSRFRPCLASCNPPHLPRPE